MAIEKLALATLSGPLEAFDRGIGLLVLDRDFHPEPAEERLASMKTLRSFEEENPYPPLIQKLEHLAETLEIPLRPKAYDLNLISLEGVEHYTEQLKKTTDSLAQRQKELSLLISDSRQIIETLQYVLGIDENLDALFQMRALAFRFGRLPREIYNEALGHIHARRDFFFIPTSLEGDFVYCMYFVLPKREEAADAFFLALQFQRIEIPPRIYGTPEAAIRRLKAEQAAAEKESTHLLLRLEALRDVSEGKLREYWTYLNTLSRAWALRQYAGHTGERFYLVGWVPQKGAALYAAEVNHLPGFSCVLAQAAKLPEADPPIKFRQGPLARIFRPFVEMYGLPGYREIDPSFFLAITYTLLFGIMFGDVGQGLVLILIGLLLKRLKNMWLGPILSLAGASSVLFGFVYGSIFGYEHLLPGFKVLEDRGPIQILFLSAGLGVFLIVLAMLLNIINGIRQKNLGKILFSPNGLSGLIFYMAILAGFLARFLLGKHLFTGLYLCAFIVAPLVFMLLENPLSKLLQGKRPWLPERPLSFLTEGLFHLFEITLSLLSNTLSFFRVGAFAIIHAGLMLVVFLLAQASQNQALLIIILGNLFVIALETLLVSIQVLRIGFHELFGRFYTASGKQFTSHQSQNTSTAH